MDIKKIAKITGGRVITANTKVLNDSLLQLNAAIVNAEHELKLYNMNVDTESGEEFQFKPIEQTLNELTQKVDTLSDKVLEVVNKNVDDFLLNEQLCRYASGISLSYVDLVKAASKYVDASGKSQLNALAKALASLRLAFKNQDAKLEDIRNLVNIAKHISVIVTKCFNGSKS